MKKRLVAVVPGVVAAGVAALVVAGAIVLSPLSYGASFPERPVRVLAASAAGGGTDIIARMVAQGLTDLWGQPVVVDNRPGGGGVIATDITAKSVPDGHTLLMQSLGITFAPALYKSLPFDLKRDLSAVVIVGSQPFVLAVHPSIAAKSVVELVHLAKARPGELRFGSGGVSGAAHLGMELFRVIAGVDIVHVPYKGTGQAVPAFMGGEVSLVVSAYPALAAHVKTGKATFVAITSANRMSQAPSATPVAELVPGFNFSSELGIVVPAGTPPAIVSRLNAELAKALQNPEVNQKLTAMGFVLISSTPEAYAENIRNNLQVFAKAVKISGAKAE